MKILSKTRFLTPPPQKKKLANDVGPKNRYVAVFE